MTNYKGTGIVFLKKQLKERGPETETAFRSKLTPEEIDIYDNCLAFSWIDIEQATKFYSTAATILFPNDSNGIQKIGKELALDNLKGVYRVLVRLATIPFVVKQAAQFWKTYHQMGKAKAVVEESKKQLYFIVEDYKKLPQNFRQLLQGYIQGVIEITGGRMVNVANAEANTTGWEWFATWN